MRQLIHNGVLVPRYIPRNLSIKIQGKIITLNPQQEEMAVAWAKKLGTKYAKDRTFVKNFFKDFCRALGVTARLKPEAFDFSPILEFIENERNLKANLSKEERKRLTEEAKIIAEANKERYGYAIVDGVKIEIGNYRVEPSSIFLGRGKHPLRGRWKEGPKEEDIELNLSPDAPVPPGNWKRIIWQPNALWIARWRDKLSGKMKYVWISESTTLKQMKDIEKFEKARELRQNLHLVKEHIWKNLNSNDIRRRKTATVCFLIDFLKIRVGDEKDPDEADTVGASTLRPEHITFGSGNRVIINFLGKDSVPHVFNIELPDIIIRNLKEFCQNAKSSLFEGVNSERVSEFLDEVIPGLSAKVFRTCYATAAVEDTLYSAQVKLEDPDYIKKYIATMANLEAAKVCNHKRTLPRGWSASLKKKMMDLKNKTEIARDKQKKIEEKIAKEKNRFSETLKKFYERIEARKNRINLLKQRLDSLKANVRYNKTNSRRIRLERKAINSYKDKIIKLRKKHRERIQKLREKLKEEKEKSSRVLEKMRLQIDSKKKTGTYNLGTSLRSYIDPRIYYEWGKRVGYDWKLYYPKSLQKKFSWVELGIRTQPLDVPTP
ncbi:MAG: DNA topoisomerase I [Nitrososphaerota archaeon]|nr:DNA topoisomerase I [Candidatus Bathyarchaeota archaeon]MDW8048401.1 DNA topoisomerase I [Nitrososphaerota archaeon]